MEIRRVLIRYEFRKGIVQQKSRNGTTCGPHHNTHGQILAKDPLIIFGHQCAFRLIAFVEEGKAEGKADTVEDERILRPAYHCAGAHNGGNVAIDKALPGKIGDLDHVFDSLLTIRVIIFARSEEHTSELQSLMRISYAVFCLKKKNN